MIQYVADDNRDRYNKKLVLAAVAKNPKFRWCPCGSSQVVESTGEYGGGRIAQYIADFRNYREQP